MASSHPRVLIVEDNLTQLDLYALVLEDHFDVLAASRGETGYEMACKEAPDAIVVDVLLPDMDGLTLCSRLQSNAFTAAIPLIVLTGDDGAHARARLRSAQFSAVLKKPCSAERLLSLLRDAVSIRSHE
jgi:CheY-like chemotaxis protein